MNSCGPLLLSQQHLQAYTQPGVRHSAGRLACVVVTSAEELCYGSSFLNAVCRGVAQSTPNPVAREGAAWDHIRNHWQ